VSDREPQHGLASAPWIRWGSPPLTPTYRAILLLLIHILNHTVKDQYEHPDYYLDEYTFRFNRRNSKARGLLFHRLMEHAAQFRPITYRVIASGMPNILKYLHLLQLERGGQPVKA
jgi:hypothetical protein